MIARKLERYIKYLKIIPPYFYFIYKDRERLYREMDRWFEVLPVEKKPQRLKQFYSLFGSLKEFRDLLYCRYKPSYFNPIPRLYPGQAYIFMAPSERIGEGLVIQHGYNAHIEPQIMGKNCQVWQNVTLGKIKKPGVNGFPKIGDNVKICCGAMVFGEVTVGDNTTIGAGAVVVKDVPANAVVVGNPARIVRLNGERVDLPL